MSDFFEAKISRNSTPPTLQPPTEPPLSQSKSSTKPHPTITIDDSPPKSVPNFISENQQEIKIEPKPAITATITKKEEVILIDDDDGDSVVRQLSYTETTTITDIIQKDPNTDSTLNSKREPPVHITDLTPEVAEVHKKLKPDDPLAKSSPDKVQSDHSDQLQNLPSPYIPVRGTKPALTSIVAIDCEMVIVNGNEHELARCSIIDYNGHVLFDKLIMPKGRITNYLTFVSGITAHNLKDAKPYTEYKSEILDILRDRIIVGHSIKNDFQALHYHPEKKHIRDIVHCKAFKMKGGTPSLKRLAADHLGWQIQGGQHSSVEDARATLALYRKVEEEWEKEISDAEYGMVRTVRLTDKKKAPTTVV